MRDKVRLLRISYWTGAVLDGLTVIPMLFPAAGAAIYGIRDFHPGPEYRYAMGLAASLMAGWTVLLIWADRKPVERKGILLLTLFPVLPGLAGAGAYAVIENVIAVDRMLPTWIVQALVATLFAWSYVSAAKTEPAGA